MAGQVPGRARLAAAAGVVRRRMEQISGVVFLGYAVSLAIDRG